METVAIVGVGLIGASFGLALRKAGFAGEIIGVSSEGAIAAGLKRGAISSSASLGEAARTADLIYLAQPVDRILETIPLLAPRSAHWNAGDRCGQHEAGNRNLCEQHLPPVLSWRSSDRG